MSTVAWAKGPPWDRPVKTSNAMHAFDPDDVLCRLPPTQTCSGAVLSAAGIVCVPSNILAPEVYCAELPPSTGTNEPVMKLASPEARKATTLATSSARATRPIGMASANC